MQIRKYLVQFFSYLLFITKPQQEYRHFFVLEGIALTKRRDGWMSAVFRQELVFARLRHLRPYRLDLLAQLLDH